MLAHMEQLEILIEDYSPCLLLLAETWLTNEISAGESSFKGYNTIRCDSESRHTGGVAIMVKNGIKYSEIYNRAFDRNTWILSIKITKGLPPGVYTVVYHSPSSSDSDFLHFFESWYEDTICEQDLSLTAGDMNIDMLKEYTYSRNFNNLINSFGLTNIVRGYTRITSHSKTQVDLVITNSSDAAVHISQSCISDHSTLHINFTEPSNNRGQRKITIMDKSAYNTNTLIANLNILNWNEITKLHINDKAAVLVNQLQTCLDKLIKKKDIIILGNNPWFTDEMRTIQKQRDLLYSRAKITKNLNDWDAYKSAKNQYNRLIKLKKNKYYEKQIDSCRGDSKKMWTKLKEILKKGGEPVQASIEFINNVADEPEEIAENFNNYFIDSVIEIHGSIVTIAEEVNLNNIDYNKNSSVFTFQKVEISKLYEVISQMKNKSSTDGITINIIKDALPVIGDVLLQVINESFQNGVFPTIWKTATIIPIPKIAGTKKCSEYRPINMLPAFEKILEQIAKEQLQNYLETEKLLIEEQSGFRKNHSCETALNFILAQWKEDMENNKKIVAVFLDLKRAFETIDRKILLEKLEKYGITGTAKNWFADYLDNRQQITTFSGVESNPKRNDLGVPQGSILGPLLFILYVNDIKKTLKSCNLNLFADDTLITISDQDVVNAIGKINNDLEHVSMWLKTNKLKLNTSKTKAMLISNKPVVEVVPSVMIDGIHLDYVAEIKYLGIIIDNKLHFKKHIDFVVRKTAKKIGFFGRISNKLNIWSKILVYKCIIAPYFEYCATVLFLATDSDLQKMQKLQNRAMRIILHCNKRTRIADMLEALQWLNIKQRIYFNVLLFIYKLLNNKLPLYMCRSVFYNRDVHSYGTRKIDHFRLPNFTKTSTQNNLYYKGLKLYNELPNEIKDAKNIRQFKKFCSQHVKQIL